MCNYNLAITLLVCLVTPGLKFQCPQGHVPSPEARQSTAGPCGVRARPDGPGAGIEKVRDAAFLLSLSGHHQLLHRARSPPSTLRTPRLLILLSSGLVYVACPAKAHVEI